MDILGESIIPAEKRIGAVPLPSRLSRIGRKLVLQQLERLRHGSLVLVEQAVTRRFGRDDAGFPIQAAIVVHDPAFYGKVLLGGSNGAAEAYMDGDWTSDCLTDVIRILVRNEAVLAEMEKGWARLLAPLQRYRHWLRMNTHKGSRFNIAAHYDLGNDFYRLFLDGTLTYSCGFFENPESSLKDASEAKYDRICTKLRLTRDDRVLEIGTGWGGFALHAAGRYGCRVTTTTISEEQYHLARQRVREAGLSERVRVIRSDYRDLTGVYDKLVSIEMIEAVGHQFYETFFRVCGERLREDGLMALQAIIIRDDRYEGQLKSPDFIKRYIFPGSCIPSISAICNAVAHKTDLRLHHLEDITSHYPRTLNAWRERFFENIDRVRSMGYSERFIRMWEYYLCYCEGSFMERYIGDLQMIFTKPFWRPDVGQVSGQ